MSNDKVSNSYYLSTWEMFLGEIERNISPTKQSIEKSFNFLLKKSACSEGKYSALVSVRYMAAYEHAINEYLHPPRDFKQANIKAELIHFGTLFEGMLETLLANLFGNNKFTQDDYNIWFPKNNNVIKIVNEQLSKVYKSGRSEAFSFKLAIDCLKKWNQYMYKNNTRLADFSRLMNALRVERNNVHINHMVSTNVFHEEYKLVEIRNKFDDFVLELEELLHHQQ